MKVMNEPEIEQAIREHCADRGVELGELVDFRISFDHEKLEKAVKSRGIDAVVNETRADIISGIRSARDLDLSSLDHAVGAVGSISAP